MRSHLLFAFFYLVSFTATSQDVLPNTPTHVINQPIYHEVVESRPDIDSALFFDYLDWELQKDSLPPPYKDGKPFSITLFYIVSKEER